MARVPSILLVLLICRFLLCRGNQTSSEFTKTPGLYPGEELIHTYLKSDSNETSKRELTGVPEQLDLIKGWIYEDNITERGKFNSAGRRTNGSIDIKRRRKYHRLKCL